MGAEAKGNNLIKDDPKVYACLIDGFAKGFTDAEACEAAGISRATLFRYCELNPEFQDRKENLKLNPVITAKSTVVEKLKGDVGVAFKYLQHRSEDFKPPNPNIIVNPILIGTVEQLQVKLALKINKWLTKGDDNITDAEVSDG